MDKLWKGVKSFFGISPTHNEKKIIMTLPRCFGVYRSPQSDAENCCDKCLRNTACFNEFKRKQKEKVPKKDEPKLDISKRDDIPTKAKPYSSATSQNHEQEFLRIFKYFTHQHSHWDIWRDFIIMAACALSNPVDKSHYDEREALYMSIIKKYNKHEQGEFPKLLAETVMALEVNPEQDFLGHIFMTLELGNRSQSQFFTPYHVCRFMGAIVMNDVAALVEERGYITLHDSCCGAGATLIAGIHEARKQLEKINLNFQNHILVTGQDIDQTVALMCYIQLSLLGVAGYVKVGNSLTDPMTPGESMRNYWFTPMYFSDVWSTRRLIQKMNSVMEREEKLTDG